MGAFGSHYISQVVVLEHNFFLYPSDHTQPASVDAYWHSIRRIKVWYGNFHIFTLVHSDIFEPSILAPYVLTSNLDRQCIIQFKWGMTTWYATWESATVVNQSLVTEPTIWQRGFVVCTELFSHCSEPLCSKSTQVGPWVFWQVWMSALWLCSLTVICKTSSYQWWCNKLVKMNSDESTRKAKWTPKIGHSALLPSLLSHCWLGGRNGIWPITRKPS